MTADGVEVDDPEQIRMKYDDVDMKLPSVSDFLFSYSTLEDYVSLRDTEDGTWYIQMLCKNIRDGVNLDISLILTFTNGDIAKMAYEDDSGEKIKMMPTYENRLTKIFYIKEPILIKEKDRQTSDLEELTKKLENFEIIENDIFKNGIEELGKQLVKK